MALCTWPMEAAAIGSSSNILYLFFQSFPNSCCITWSTCHCGIWSALFLTRSKMYWISFGMTVSSFNNIFNSKITMLIPYLVCLASGLASMHHHVPYKACSLSVQYCHWIRLDLVEILKVKWIEWTGFFNQTTHHWRFPCFFVLFQLMYLPLCQLLNLWNTKMFYLLFFE